MKVFLAGTKAYLKLDIVYEIPYVLESFAYYDERQKRQMKNAKMFLLDSGAFTFMNSKSGKIDFDSYLDKYIDFINQNGINYFFELDIDSVVGYQKVKEYRRKLESKTGKRCIPVWHKSRGLDDFIQTAKDYNYMAIGGIAARNISKKHYRYFETLLNIAHGYGCKVHGLGFTSTALLHKYKFDSVDSTSWASGSRFGQIHKFDGEKIVSSVNKNKRVTDGALINRDNIREWIKFQEFADSYL